MTAEIDERPPFVVTSMAYTSDVADAAAQLRQRFEEALAAETAAQPWPLPFRVWIGLCIYHPSVPGGRPGRGQYHRGSRSLLASADVDYAAWVDGDWARRTDSWAAAAAGAVSRMPKTRLSPDERLYLAGLIERTRLLVRASPPAVVVPLDPSAFQPAAAAPPPQQPEPCKLYRRIEGQLHYRESWIHGGQMTIHTGLCGEIGESTVQPVSDADARAAMAEFKRLAMADGYRPIAPSRHIRLIIEYPPDFAEPASLDDRLVEMETFFNNLVGWLGLGECDGSAFGRSGVEICCFVVHFDLAKAALEKCLAVSPYRNYTRIFREL